MMAKKEPRAVLMAGAAVKDYDFFTPMPDDFVICADGGYRHALRLGIVPKVLVGDFDSLEAPRPSGAEILQFPPEKNETDLQLAMQCAIDRGYRHIYVLGAFGGRVDHFLGNISLMKWATDRGATVVMEDANTRLYMTKSKLFVPKSENRYLSILPFSGDAQVSLKGVKYPAEKTWFLSGETLGISNEITADAAEIIVHAGMVLVMDCRADRVL